MIREFCTDMLALDQLWARAFRGWRTREFWRDPERVCGCYCALLAILTILLGLQALIVARVYGG